MAIATYLTIITLNVNRMLSSKDIGWLNGFKKQDLCLCCLQRSTSDQKTHRLKVKEWKKMFHAIGNGKKKKLG